MRATFDAEVPGRIRRASSVRLEHFIPAHWFAAAASECAGMYIAGFFYGAISISQAYVEALTKYLAEHHLVRVGKDAAERCKRLHAKGVLSTSARDAAVLVLNDRNDFHHLNKMESRTIRSWRRERRNVSTCCTSLNPRCSRIRSPWRTRVKRCSGSRSTGHHRRPGRPKSTCVSYGKCHQTSSMHATCADPCARWAPLANHRSGEGAPARLPRWHELVISFPQGRRIR
jgi:hypothetical protein